MQTEWNINVLGNFVMFPEHIHVPEKQTLPFWVSVVGFWCHLINVRDNKSSIQAIDLNHVWNECTKMKQLEVIAVA